MGSADTNDTNIKGQVLNGEEHIQMQSADPFKTNGEDEQKHHQKETTSEATELEENQQRDQTIGRYKEEEEEDQVEELLKEWNSVEKFRLKTFFVSLFFASLSFFDFFFFFLVSNSYKKDLCLTLRKRMEPSSMTIVQRSTSRSTTIPTTSSQDNTMRGLTLVKITTECTALPPSQSCFFLGFSGMPTSKLNTALGNSLQASSSLSSW